MWVVVYSTAVHLIKTWTDTENQNLRNRFNFNLSSLLEKLYLKWVAREVGADPYLQSVVNVRKSVIDLNVNKEAVVKDETAQLAETEEEELEVPDENLGESQRTVHQSLNS